MSRYRRKVDANQAAVTKELRQLGCFVETGLSRVGQGVPDMLIGFRGRWHLVELKNPEMVPSKRRLTGPESDWHAKAIPYAPVIVAETTEQIMEMIRPALLDNSDTEGS